MNRIAAVLAVASAIFLSTACRAPATEEPPATKTEPQPAAKPEQLPAKAEHVFRGKVLKVDAAAKRLNVDGENVEGWMGAMTMDYATDKPELFDKIKAGDTITARVFDGDFTLHDVQVVPAAAKP